MKARKTLAIWYSEERSNRNKIEIWAISTKNCKRTAKLLMFRSDFFGEWMDFQISLPLWDWQVIRDCLCVRDIAKTSLNKLLLLLILKSSCPSRSCSVEKGALRNFTGKHLVLEYLFNKVTGVSQRRCFLLNLQNFKELLFLRKSVSSCNFIYNGWKR